MSKVKVDIWNLCVVRSYAKMEELLVVAIKVDWVFGEIDEHHIGRKWRKEFGGNNCE